MPDFFHKVFFHKVFFRAWLVWLIATLFVVYAFLLNTAGAVFGDAIKHSLHLSEIEASLAIGSFIIGFACMQIPAGYLLDRFPLRLVMSSGLFVLALGNLTLSFASSLPSFVLSNFIQGLGASFAFIAAAKLISEWFQARSFPIFFGLTQALSCILTAIIHFYLVEALQDNSWQSIYQKLSCFGFILLVFMVIFVKSPKKTRQVVSQKNKQNDEISLGLGKSFRMVAHNQQVWLAAVAAATSFGALTAYASYWYLSVQKYFDVQTPQALMISGMIFVGIGIGTPFLGWLSNRVGSRSLVLHFSLVLGAIFLLLGLYLPHFNINTYVPIKIVSFCIGFFLSGSMLYYTSVSEISTQKTRALALGIVNTFVFLFNTFLLFIPQMFMTKQSQLFFTSLWVLPVSVLVAILLARFVRETFPASKNSSG